MNMVDELTPHMHTHTGEDTHTRTCVHTKCIPYPIWTPHTNTKRYSFKKGFYRVCCHHEGSLRKQNTFFQFVSKSRPGPSATDTHFTGMSKGGWGDGSVAEGTHYPA